MVFSPRMVFTQWVTISVVASVALPPALAQVAESVCEIADGGGCAEEIGAGLVQILTATRLTQEAKNPAESGNISAAPGITSAATISPLELDTLNDGNIHFPVVPYYFQAPPKPDMTIFPISWFHVPKCGSSFLNALIRVPGVCHGIPADLAITDATMGPDNIAGFFERYPAMMYCATNGTKNFFTMGGHDGLGNQSNYEQHWKGRGITILRKPEQRLISSYKNMYHSWPLSLDMPVPENNMSAYAHQLQGCMVKMLNRNGTSHRVYDVPNNGDSFGPHWGGPCGESPLPTLEELEVAKMRLRTFLFVGLQEEWELSMCLFHATFGGQCQNSEFVNTRHAGPAKPPKRHYDEAFWLGDWKDPYDGPLYAEAQRLFWGRMRALRLSVVTCKPCFDQAGIQYVPSHAY